MKIRKKYEKLKYKTRITRENLIIYYFEINKKWIFEIKWDLFIYYP